MSLKSLLSKTTTGPAFVVAEGIHRTWFYHVRQPDPARYALCGADTLDKDLPMRLWGFRGHIGERYCQKCQAIAMERGILPPAGGSAP